MTPCPTPFLWRAWWRWTTHRRKPSSALWANVHHPHPHHHLCHFCHRTVEK
jgi:hypothetical protein